MKKFYTVFAFALAASLCAGAQQAAPAHLNHATAAPATIKAVKSVNAPAYAPAPTTVAEVIGDYDYSYEDQYAESEAEMIVRGKTVIAQGPLANTVTIVIPVPSSSASFTVNATFNDGNLVIPSGQTVNLTAGVVNVNLYKWNAQGTSFSPVESIESVWTGLGFVFDPDCMLALQDSAGGWYFAASAFTFNKCEADNSTWTNIGEATFADGWILPLFGIDQTKPENQYKVAVEQNDSDPNRYRLVNPYRGNCPVAIRNQSNVDPAYIAFNVSDPDHVTFDCQDAGFAYYPVGLTDIYPSNSLSTCMGVMDLSLEDAVALIGSDVSYTTFKNGVVTVPSEAANGNYFNDACFGLSTAPFGGYGWSDNNNISANMFCSITLPANSVNGVTVNDNAPVEYFNLQGVRVAAPSNGLFIRRQGNSVSKVFIK